jgi:hypothetical protein
VSEIDPNSATARAISNASEPLVPAPRTHGDVSGPNLAARIMEELRINPPTDGSAKAPAKGTLQPEQSSSQLTDMLNGASPSRADFRSYDSSSAVPSPLNKTISSVGPQQSSTNVPIPSSGQAPPVFPAIPTPPQPRVGVPIHDHFYMTNEHIDVVAMSIYDWVQACNNQAIKTASSKHEQLKATVEQRFDDIQSQVNSVGEKADHNGNQSHNLSIQLDKLRDFIKAEVVEPLAAQTARLNAMDHGIKELQKSVQELQSQSQASTTAYPSPYQVCIFLCCSRTFANVNT